MTIKLDMYNYTVTFYHNGIECDSYVLNARRLKSKYCRLKYYFALELCPKKCYSDFQVVSTPKHIISKSK